MDACELQGWDGHDGCFGGEVLLHILSPLSGTVHTRWTRYTVTVTITVIGQATNAWRPLGSQTRLMGQKTSARGNCWTATREESARIACWAPSRSAHRCSGRWHWAFTDW